MIDLYTVGQTIIFITTATCAGVGYEVNLTSPTIMEPVEVVASSECVKQVPPDTGEAVQSSMTAQGLEWAKEDWTPSTAAVAAVELLESRTRSDLLKFLAYPDWEAVNNNYVVYRDPEESAADRQAAWYYVLDSGWSDYYPRRQ